MEACAQKQTIWNKKVERRLLGKNLHLGQRLQPAASAEQAGGVNRRRRDEAAASDEDYEGFDECFSDQKEEWTLKTDGGLLSCWWQTVRKRGSIQDGKTPCRSGVIDNRN